MSANLKDYLCFFFLGLILCIFHAFYSISLVAIENQVRSSMYLITIVGIVEWSHEPHLQSTTFLSESHCIFNFAMNFPRFFFPSVTWSDTQATEKLNTETLLKASNEIKNCSMLYTLFFFIKKKTTSCS